MESKTQATVRPTDLFELATRFQKLLNSQSLITPFLQFAKNAEEMRKKWQTSEERNRELESQLHAYETERNVLHRKVNELKIDIEIHYEKRMQAEAERDKLQKQIETFKLILAGTCGADLPPQSPTKSPSKPRKQRKRSSIAYHDETGSLISDYTLDDLESPQKHRKRRTNYLNTNIDSLKQRMSMSMDQGHCQPELQKRVRTRSNTSPKGVTAITRLRLSADGRPIELTAEIQSSKSPPMKRRDVQPPSSSSDSEAVQSEAQMVPQNVERRGCVKRSHLFESFIAKMNARPCAQCDKKAKYGKAMLRCRECEVSLHAECREKFVRPCYFAFSYPHNGFVRDYVPHTQMPKVPPFLHYAIDEIEMRGLAKEIGLYRCTGSDGQIKQLKEKLVKRQQLPDLRKISDIHVLCSFIKDFLSGLNEHLVTYALWEEFARVCEINDFEDRKNEMKGLIERLPLANRHTLAFVTLHLKRIVDSAECKMNVTAMAYVMGPAIVGNSSAHLEAAEIVNEHRIQHLIADALLQMDSMFYEETLMSTADFENEENETPCKLIKNNPQTPELLRKTKTASVLTSILGPARNSHANLVSQKSHLNIFKTKQVTLTPGREHNSRAVRNFQFNTPNF